MKGPRLNLTRRPIPPSTRALVDHLAQGDPDGSVTFAELLDEFSERAWGLFLLLALLPNFIPIPGAGAISGPIVVLIGVQLLFHVEHPWLPGFMARRATSSLSMRAPSRSTTSMRQPSQSKCSPACGMRPKWAITMPATVV